MSDTEDPRKTGLKNGLRQLTIEQLERVLNYPNEMILDEFNYYDGKFCPLAVAVGLNDMHDPTHEKVYDKLVNLGYKVYNTRGLNGSFYTNNRRDDLIIAVKEVIEEKKMLTIKKLWISIKNKNIISFFGHEFNYNGAILKCKKCETDIGLWARDFPRICVMYPGDDKKRTSFRVLEEEDNINVILKCDEVCIKNIIE